MGRFVSMSQAASQFISHGIHYTLAVHRQPCLLSWATFLSVHLGTTLSSLVLHSKITSSVFLIKTQWSHILHLWGTSYGVPTPSLDKHNGGRDGEELVTKERGVWRMIFLPLLVIAFWTGSLSQWGSLENTVELVSGGIGTYPLALLWSTFRVLSAFQELPWAWLRHTSQWPVLIIYILQMPFFLWVCGYQGCQEIFIYHQQRSVYYMDFICLKIKFFLSPTTFGVVQKIDYLN